MWVIGLIETLSMAKKSPVPFFGGKILMVRII